MKTIIQNTNDRFKIKVGLDMTNGNIEIMNGGTVIRIGKMGRKIDMFPHEL